MAKITHRWMALHNYQEQQITRMGDAYKRCSYSESGTFIYLYLRTSEDMGGSKGML